MVTLLIEHVKVVLIQIAFLVQQEFLLVLLVIAQLILQTI
jgi:hypothetical protein